MLEYKDKVIDDGVRLLRVKENLNIWETSMTKYPNIKYIPSTAQQLKEILKRNHCIRMVIKNGSAIQNEKKGYAIAKYLINAGLSPSNVCITNIEDCYLSVRGFGDSAAVKDKIFRNTNKLIIIENMREMRPTDIKDNVDTFWQEFWAYCRKNRDLNVLLCFDETNIFEENKVKDWYPREQGKAPHKELNFCYG